MPPKKKHQSPPPGDGSVEGSDASAAVLQLVQLLRDGLASSLPSSRWRPNENPTFSGELHEQPEKFIERAKAHFEATSVPEDQYVHEIKSCLKDKAARWFKPFANLDMSWDSFTQRFLEEFESADARTKLHMSLHTDAQGSHESGRDFVARKMTLAQRCSPASQLDILESTISLLRHEYRFSLALHEIHDFNTLLDLVTLLDRRNLPRSSQSTSSSSTRRPPPPPAPAAPQPSTSRAPVRRASDGLPPYACRHCNEMHWMRDCPVAIAKARPAPQAASTSASRPNPRPQASTSAKQEQKPKNA